ncbi:nicotinate-nucleotide adenylyltransferase [Candidatus Margulisiibacteriota bacterium]
MEKVGLLGGTFDPIHNGHIKIAQTVQQKFNLAKIIFIPSKIPPHRAKQMANDEQRLKMLELAVKDHPGFEISTIELERDAVSYTLETLKKLKNEGQEFYFLLGADAMEILPTWREPEKVLELASFIVVSRPGYDFKKIKEFLNKEPFVKHKNKVQFFQMDSLDISASDIRQAISENKDVSGLVPDKVLKYIQEEQLYKKF